MTEHSKECDNAREIAIEQAARTWKAQEAERLAWKSRDVARKACPRCKELRG